MTASNEKVGDCYKVAFESLLELSQMDESGLAAQKGWTLTPLYLVHGTTVSPVGPAKGKTIDHAWVETAGDVLELSNGNENRYSITNWQTTYTGVARVRYTKDQAQRLAKEMGHYGPWDK
jgi:hypothetical protein